MRTCKPQKKYNFWSFLAPNAIFPHIVAFLILVYLIYSIGQLSCCFQRNWSDTVKLRSTFFEFFGKPRKTRFLLNNFLAQKVIFLLSILPFLLFAHLLRSNGQLCCEFERYWSSTVRIREWRSIWKIGSQNQLRLTLKNWQNEERKILFYASVFNFTPFISKWPAILYFWE